MSTIDWIELTQAANDARAKAWAPYSHYRVGAAILTESGAIVTGCNVENASYGLTVCAERTAIVTMVAQGEHKLRALVVVTAGPEPGPPCGMCRQVLAEFADDDLPILLAVAGEPSPRILTSLVELFPNPFRLRSP